MDTKLTLRHIAVNSVIHANAMRHRPLFEKCGGISGFFEESEKALSAIYKEAHLKNDFFDRKKALRSAEEELKNIEKHNIRICSFEDSDYPYLLAECCDAPLVFYYKGQPPRHSVPALAIVGTRRSSVPYREHVNSVVKELGNSSDDLIIVSGLAFGIDGAAHQAAMQYNLKTYAVLGHGLHMIYPAAHKNMANQIIEKGGCLISEFSCSAITHPAYFLKRNRIIAGICHATLIAESAEKGGAMSTARIAHSYGRDVLAFPGQPKDRMSKGCNLLIKENIAALVENGEDILKIMGLNTTPSACQLSLNFPNNEPSLTQTLLSIIEENKCINIDELHSLTKIPIQQLTATLLEMELNEKIISLPGYNYILK